MQLHTQIIDSAFAGRRIEQRQDILLYELATSAPIKRRLGIKDLAGFGGQVTMY
jgi:hypothetical protein